MFVYIIRNIKDMTQLIWRESMAAKFTARFLNLRAPLKTVIWTGLCAEVYRPDFQMVVGLGL